MTTTKINTINPITGKREVMALNNETKRAKNSKGKSWSLKYLISKDKNGIGYFETCKNGKVIQKTGKYEKSN